MFENLTLAVLLSRLIALLVGTTFHEYMHNFVGWLMGDNTPEAQGRLTLDPRKHIYWPGFLMFVVLGFGVLGTAPISAGRMNYPRVKWGEQLSRAQRFGLAVLAGPGGNLIVAVVFGIFFRLAFATVPEVVTAIPGGVGSQLSRTVPGVGNILIDLVFWNALLLFFNLIPLGPLDGRYILGSLLPPQYRFQYENFQNQYGMYALLGLIFLSFVINVFGILILEPTYALTNFLLGA